ncbi:alpha-L-fucosidase [Dactylosporangium sp. NPDC048998]|uniref:alpha-L-fucosidase n=1 Tax=Dactylosporangium sp. NPDC048998 TaxID=3363976 RepID=UPI003716214B
MAIAPWFEEAALGLFVHWDHTSQQGIEISWPLVDRSIIPGREHAEAQITAAQYHATAATFNPQRWDASQLARLARNSGVRYLIFTARHHAGYSMFHTKQSEYSIEHSPYQADITREIFDALRKEGVRVGLYYSLSDWHHPDYPSFTDEDRPYSIHNNRRSAPEAWARYIDYVKAQLRELLTGYGQIDLIWFDGEWERTEEEWRPKEIRDLVKSLQPNVVINDRLLGQGDYATPEQGMPATPPDSPWEMCLSIGESWAWRPDDTDFKPPRQLAEYLAETVSRGGNLLLGLAIKDDGTFPAGEVSRVKSLGAWLATHGESIYGTRPASKDIQFHGPITTRQNWIYLHLVMIPIGKAVVRGLPVRRIADVKLLGTEDSLKYTVNLEIHESDENDVDVTGELFIDFPGPTGALIDVIAIELLKDAN